jgi:hypothetical protein
MAPEALRGISFSHFFEFKFPSPSRCAGTGGFRFDIFYVSFGVLSCLVLFGRVVSGACNDYDRVRPNFSIVGTSLAFQERSVSRETRGKNRRATRSRQRRVRAEPTRPMVHGLPSLPRSDSLKSRLRPRPSGRTSYDIALRRVVLRRWLGLRAGRSVLPH